MGTGHLLTVDGIREARTFARQLSAAVDRAAHVAAQYPNASGNYAASQWTDAADQGRRWMRGMRDHARWMLARASTRSMWRALHALVLLLSDMLGEPIVYPGVRGRATGRALIPATVLPLP